MAALEIGEARADELASWDARVAGSPGGFLFQSTRWGSFWQEYVGGQPHYWVARDGAGHVAGMLMTISEALAWEPLFERPFGGLALGALRRLALRHDARHGPVLLDRRRQDDVLWSFAGHLRDQAAGCRPLSSIRLTTPIYPTEGPEKVVFEQCGFESTEIYTLCVDLRPEEDALWNGLHRSARKAISRARREGITVRRVHDEDELRHLYTAVQTARRRLGLRTFSYRNWEVMWKWLAPVDAVHVFVAETDGRGPLGVLGLWAFGDMVQEFASVRMADDTTAGDLLKWEAIRWAKLRGRMTFDLAGVNPRPDASEKERQIYQFKGKWGGQLVRYWRHTRCDGWLAWLRWRR